MLQHALLRHVFWSIFLDMVLDYTLISWYTTHLVVQNVLSGNDMLLQSPMVRATVQFSSSARQVNNKHSLKYLEKFLNSRIDLKRLNYKPSDSDMTC